MKAEPTSGEWKQSGIVIYAEDHGVVCELSEPRASKWIEHQPLGLGSKDWQEAMANAQLIVAAKDLRDALENTMTQLRRWQDEKPELWDAIIDPGMMVAWDANRAAIAKARGEAPRQRADA